MIPVVIRHRAEADLERARAWYARDDHRLEAAFVDEFDRKVQRMRALPDQFPEVGRQVHRAWLHRFPYATYFVRRATSQSSSRFFISIADQAHGSRSPISRERANPVAADGGRGDHEPPRLKRHVGPTVSLIPSGDSPRGASPERGDPPGFDACMGPH
jgi:hypothetical protein